MREVQGLLEYLIDVDAVDAMLAPYPRLEAIANGMHTSPSRAQPSSRWRVCTSRLGAFLAGASRVQNPAPRLRIVEAALASPSIRTFSRTSAEDEFSALLAQLLLAASLVDSGFEFHPLPAMSEKKPDVTGTFPDLGTLSTEVYKPSDDPAADAYRWELWDATKLADVPWSYTTNISWHERPDRDLSRDGSHKKRHPRIRRVLEDLFPNGDARALQSSATAPLVDDWLGLSATVRLTHVQPWTSSASTPARVTIMGRNDRPWNVESQADAVANKIVNKAQLRQAQSRQANWRLLVVDCSALLSTPDLSLFPDDRTIDALCDAIGGRRDEFPPDLDGVVVWNPNVPPGEGRRLVAVTEGTPSLLCDALAGCPWTATRETSGLLRLDAGPA